MAATASTARSRSSSIPEAAAPGHLGEWVAAQLDALLRLHATSAEAAARVRQVYALLTRESLDRPAAPPFGGLSCINAGGLPFQWVQRIGRGHSGWGFLCESGRAGSPVAERARHSLQLVARACAAAGGAEPAFLAAVADVVLPRACEPWPAHWRSAVWCGVAVGGEAISVRPYFNLNRDHCRDRWLRIGWVLKSLGRERALRRLCDLSGACSQDSWPVGLAVEGACDGSAGRVKVYFRSAATTPAWLARWYQAAGFGPDAAVVRRFLDLLGLAGGERYPAGSFVVSLEIHADERLSLKTDLAVTKWLETDAEVIEPVRALLRDLGGDPALPGRFRAAIGAGPGGAALTRFVGLGLEPDGAPHVNIYVEPPLAGAAAAGARPGGSRRVPRRATGDAARRGLRGLVAAREAEGWSDFALPVGVSDAWVTGYVLTMLADARADWLEPFTAEIDGALGWLARARTAGAGWGYNAWVPDDADSTAWAILALRTWNRPVPREALRFLRRCRRPGGFATYPADASPREVWSHPTPDVTAVAARAAGDARGVRADAAAYWWASPLYTLAMGLEGAPPERPDDIRARLAGVVPVGAFERALLLRARLRLGLAPAGLARELAEAQLPAGLWPGSALLRLPREGVPRPDTVIDSGPLYRDERGVFTTATVLGALGLAGRRGGSGS